MKKQKSLILLWAPVIIWAGIIFIVSSVETVKVTQFFLWDFIAKKGAHFTEYAILYLLVYRSTGKNIAASLILTTIYALSDEFHQSFVPGRTAAYHDVLIDFCGASSAAFAIWKLQQVNHPILKKLPKNWLAS